ncbi:MAG: biopolymer transporter ExbD [Spirochaetaceae bacterium]|jgi:biopolymer transport protein ExbD|nr:biopolymer transporter ExbD [Spirochaetaceae bacterium]
MNLRREKRKLFEPSSVLSDLAFLLIIYFIVISGFNINKGFLMNLPAKDSTRLLLKEDIMRYELSGSGKVSYNGREITLDDAGRDISALIQNHPNLAVLLTISPEAPWQSVVSFVELAEKLSVNSFSFKIAEGGQP